MNNKFETLDFYPLSKNKKRYSEGGLRKNSVNKISLPNKPLITIITVVFNGDKYLQETIDSIKKQNYKNNKPFYLQMMGYVYLRYFL